MPGNWKHRILKHEETPPQGVWDDIAKKLDEDEQEKAPGLAERMTAYEVSPPLAAWGAITAELDSEEAKIIAIRPGRRALYLRYAAAAVAVICLVTAVVWQTRTNPGENIGTTATIGIPETNAALPVSTPVSTNSSSKAQPGYIAKQAPEKEENVIPEAVDIDAITYATISEPSALAGDPFDNGKEKFINSNGDHAVNTELVNLPDRYVIMAGPGGISKRVSTKLSAYIGYLTSDMPETEEALDVIIREGAFWKNKLKNWSDKLINNTISPTLSNFMDVVEWSNLLAEVP